MKLVILHEYGAPDHYRGCVEAARRLGFSEVREVEFGVLRLFAKAVLRGDPGACLEVGRDFVWCLQCLLRPSRLAGVTVVLGMAPFDWRLLLLARALGAARVVYHSSWPRWRPDEVPRRPPWPLRGAVLRRWRSFLDREVARCALVTPAVAESMSSFVPVTGARARIVHHVVAREDFHEEGSRPEAPRRAVFVGRLVPEKGAETVLELARAEPEIEFVLVGAGSQRQDLDAAARDLANVEIVGRVDSRDVLRRIYSSAHFVLQPSRRTDAWEELFGIALVEAMACGCVPLASDHVGPRAILGNTPLEVGLLAEEDFLASARRIMSGMPADRLGELSAAAVRRAGDFELEPVAEAWRQVLVAP